MRDLTMEITMAGETRAMEKQLEETRRYNDLIGILKGIKAYAEKMDVFIKNGEALRAARLLPIYDVWSSDRKEKTLYANGITHRLGYINTLCAGIYEGKAPIVSLGVLGGGANGNVSVVYYNGEVWLGDEDGECLIPLGDIASEKISTIVRRMDDYTHEAKKFLNDLDEGTFEGKLAKCIESVL